jgi:hypothetical protein
MLTQHVSVERLDAAMQNLTHTTPLTLVILSDVRVHARASRRTPKMLVATMQRQGVPPETSRVERLDATTQRILHRGPSALPRSLRREVPLRMTDVNSIVEHVRHSLRRNSPNALMHSPLKRGDEH